jgi:hypothetical protein
MTIPDRCAPRTGSDPNNAALGVAIISFDWRYRYLDPVGAAHRRVSREEATGRLVTDLFPDVEGTIFQTTRFCIARIPHGRHLFVALLPTPA